MAQTYGELMTEIVSFPYSKDMFELEKECAELDLMNSYIENQLYLRETFGENVNIDYMLEAADQSKFSKVLDKIKEVGASIGKRLWDLFMRLLDMIRRAALAVTNYVKSKFKKETITEAKKLLTSAIAEVKSMKESTDYMQEKGNDNGNGNKGRGYRNQILNAFLDAYKKACGKYTIDRLPFQAHSDSELNEILRHINMYFGKRNSNVENNDWYNLENFFKEGYKTNEDVITLATKFLDMLSPKTFDGVNFVFKVDEEILDSFPIMEVNDYIDSLHAISAKYTTFEGIIRNVIGSGNSFYVALFLRTLQMSVFKIPITATWYIFPYTALAMFTSYIAIICVLDYLIDKDLLNPKSSVTLQIDLRSTGSGVYNASVNTQNEFKKTFEDLQTILAKLGSDYGKELKRRNQDELTKIADNIASPLASLKRGGRAIWNATCSKILRMFRWSPDTIDRFRSENVRKSFALDIKKYYQIGVNITTLMNVAELVGNMIYDISQEVTKAGKKASSNTNNTNTKNTNNKDKNDDNKNDNDKNNKDGN